MTRRPVANGAARRTSQWPIVVALGLVLSEIGVFFGSVPLAIGGLILFAGSCSGLVHEAGYAPSPTRPMGWFGALFVLLGTSLWVTSVSTVTIPALLAAPANDGLALRGAAIVVAGGLLVAASYVGGIWAAITRRWR